MNANHGLRGIVAAALLAGVACAANAGELRPLSENEMSDVYGRGLDGSAAFGALTAQEQAGAFASATDAQASLAALSSDGTKNLERQLAQQQFQTANVGVQNTIKMAQTLATVSQLLTPVAITLPVMPLPFFLGLGALGGLGSLPALPSLPNNGNNGKGHGS